MRRSLAALLIVLAAVALAGCSSGGGGGGSGTTAGESGSGSAEGGSGGSGSGGGGGLAVGWVFPGAADADAVSALEAAFPDQVTSSVAENAGDDPGAAAQQLVADGATLVVSEAPGACAAIPDVHCVDAGGGPPAANAVALDAQFWNRAYLLGRAAGLLTKTDVVGYVAAGDSPAEKAAINAWALGCQSGNPNCIVRLVVAPPNARKAVKQLEKQNADILAETGGDQAVCEAAGDVPVQPVVALGDPCGTAFAVADLGAAVQPLVRSELDGSWEGGRGLSIPAGAWAADVPADVVQKVDARAKEIADGRNVFVGPLFDNQGKQQLAEGEELSPDAIASGWTWYLGGVLTSS